MPSLLRPANLFLLLSYLLLSSLPFFALLQGKPLDHPSRLLAMEFIAWLTAWAVCKRPAWFHWLLLPAFLALPTEIYLRMFYGQGISTHHLGIIAETSPKESLEFLGQKVWLMLAVMVGVIVWWWAGLKAARGTRDLDWNDGSRWLTIALLLAGAGVGAYGYEYGVESASASASSAAAHSASSATHPESSKGSDTASGFGAGHSDPDEDEEASASSAHSA